MKKISVLVSCLILISCSSSKKTVDKPAPVVSDFQNTITEEGLYIDLSFLASDSLKGRDTGSEGERIAANYLAEKYSALGLTPVGDDETYFQPYELERSILDSIRYTITREGEIINSSTHSKNSLANLSTLQGGFDSVIGSIVFVGYGIYDESIGINHFNADVNGKWIMSFYERGISSFSALRTQVEEEGALGAILISSADSTEFLEQAFIAQADFETPSRLTLGYLNEDNPEATFSAIHPDLAIELLGLNNITDLAELELSIKENPENFQAYEVDATLSHNPFIRKLTTNTRNVVAYLEGTNPELSDEVIVLSAHYDHVGVGSPDASGDTIYNGADDDGSGTVGLLHAAQALKLAKEAGADIQRSVLFLHVSGEERGLFGSRYYSDHPIFPIDKTIANLNVDMIGRRDNENADNPNYVYIIGGKIISNGLQQIIEEANTSSVNLELSDRYNDLNDPNQFYRRSDHWNFGRLGIPFAFFFNGTHDDYHQPSDEIEKIDFEALRKRTQLLFMTTALLSNTDTLPQVDNQAFIERTRQ